MTNKTSLAEQIDLDNIAKLCAKCGACTAVCPIYQITGRESLSARGRLHLLSKMTAPGTSATLAEIFSKCLLCGACTNACPRGIDIQALLLQAREEIHGRPGTASLKKLIARQTLTKPLVLNVLGKTIRTFGNAAAFLPRDSGLRLKLTAVSADFSPGKNFIARQRKTSVPPQALYFTGCPANYINPNIGLASKRLVNRICQQNLYAPEDQTCCGMAALAAGDCNQAMDLAKKNIAAFSTAGCQGIPIITSCASCFAQLKDYPRLLARDKTWAKPAEDFAQRVWEFSTYLIEHGHQIQAAFTGSPNPQKVVYHDPCHLRFPAGKETKLKIIDPPRQLIKIVPGLILTELPHGPQCCGQGGLFSLSHPDLSQQIGRKLWSDFNATKAALVTTTCTGCLLQWQQGLTSAGSRPQVRHLALLLSDYLQ